ncbi:MAG TPA: class B sortase [Candidatus Eisenbergiella merdipullorum]|uniref:Class B sortase n=1 Tax=Candidatus Eisenbergiella merdipullorum TaxID=2838553 RepID=A0A9D2I5X3_9FIRM|nr:class B sortase [Candidatus Eisenbergiella merdipullorum]
MRKTTKAVLYLKKRLITTVSLLCVFIAAAGVPAGCAPAPGDEAQETQTQEDRPELVLENFLMEDGYLDLEALQALNSECYAWISIEGTGMSFPLMQPSEDLSWYLSHDFWGNEDDNGCIYTEYYNNKDFQDPNTVIYGRNTESRFGMLHQYQDLSYFNEHREIKIYLADKVLTYRIFAAYPYDDRHLIMTYDFWDTNVFSTYLADVFSQRQMDAFIDDSMEVTVDDKIITLSTGVTGESEKRYLVQAVLVSE